MKDRFLHNLRASVAVHIGLIAGIVVFSLVGSCLQKKSPEPLMIIDLQVALPPSPETAEKAPEAPSPPEPVAPIQPEPVNDVLEDKEPPKPPPKKPLIEKSTRKIRRTSAASAPKTPPLTPEEIRRLLSQGARVSDRTVIPQNTVPFAWYYQLVRQVMYDAWIQPGELSASAGLTAQVTIRVERDGSITKRAMTRPSGNATMDDSVMKAVHSVPRLKPLPDGFGSGNQDITIEFELTNGL